MIAKKIFSPGWAMAELISMRLLPLWVGARGIEFSWKYIQLSFEANISLVSNMFVYNVHSSVCLCQIFLVLVWVFVGFRLFCLTLPSSCLVPLFPSLFFPIHSMCPNVYLTVPSPPGSPHYNGDANLDVD